MSCLGPNMAKANINSEQCECNYGEKQLTEYKECHKERLEEERRFWKEDYKNEVLVYIRDSPDMQGDKREKKIHEFLKQLLHLAEMNKQQVNLVNTLDEVDTYTSTIQPKNYNLSYADIIEVINNLLENEMVYHKGAWSTIKSRLSHRGRKKRLDKFIQDPLKYFSRTSHFIIDNWRQFYNYKPVGTTKATHPQCCTKKKNEHTPTTTTNSTTEGKMGSNTRGGRAKKKKSKKITPKNKGRNWKLGGGKKTKRRRKMKRRRKTKRRRKKKRGRTKRKRT
jgi:hypothetical protein